MKIARLQQSVHAWLELILILAVLAAVGGALAALGRSRLTAEVYAQRLQALHANYEQLRQAYNQAVARTAVTELAVADGRVEVIIRTADGRLRRIPVACNPDREVYVDFVVLDNRLWIRRVFDDSMPPSRAALIDPGLAQIDWNAAGAKAGQAVYRRLAPGRWVVTVTGNGALGLEPAAADAVVELMPPPEIREFDSLRREIAAAQDRVSTMDLFRAALSSGRAAGSTQ